MLGKVDAGVGAVERALSSLRASCVPRPARSIEALNERVRYVAFTGFRHAELNARYYADRGGAVNGRETYWTAARELFIYMRPDGRSWAIAARADYRGSAAGRFAGGFARKQHAGLMSPAKWEEPDAQGHFTATGSRPTVHGTVKLLRPLIARSL